MELEQLRGTWVRRGIHGERLYVSPFPLPFNYGFCPDLEGEDGSGLDILLLGRGRYAQGDRIGVQVVAMVDFQDGPDWDPKLVARTYPDPRPLVWHEDIRVRALFWALARVKSSRHFAGARAQPAEFAGIYGRPADG